MITKNNFNDIIILMINTKELRKVAKLIRIKMSDEELNSMASQVSKILDFAETLSEVDCSGTEINLGGTIDTMYEREDKVTDGDKPELILKNAPLKKCNMFSVPKIIE